MAKKSMIEREKKRRILNEKHGKKRQELKDIIVDLSLSDEERSDAVIMLQSLPRKSSICNQRRRCLLCGRPRGNNRLTGLCRIHMRNAVMNGLVPGMRKASW